MDEKCLPEYGEPSCMVVVYQHWNFNGWNSIFGVGNHSLNSLLAAGAVDD